MYMQLMWFGFVKEAGGESFGLIDTSNFSEYGLESSSVATRGSYLKIPRWRRGFRWASDRTEDILIVFLFPKAAGWSVTEGGCES